MTSDSVHTSREADVSWYSCGNWPRGDGADVQWQVVF